MHSAFVSNVAKLEDNHFLLNFGVMIFNHETGEHISDNSVMMNPANGTTNQIVEIKDGKIIYQCSLQSPVFNIVYRAWHINPYDTEK